jgi:hypothetical protein
MTRPASLENLRHHRPPMPLRFPSSQPEWDLGQSIRHLHLCMILHELLVSAAGKGTAVGSDQFVYFDAANPRRCLAPDGFVKLGMPMDMFESWKVWERGAPDLAIEVLSPSDTREPLTFAEKLERYASVGVRELVVFDIDAPTGTRLRAWDRLNDELVERVVEGERAACMTLGGFFVLAPANDQPIALRLAKGPDGTELIPTHEEAELAAITARDAAVAAQNAAIAAQRAAVAEKDAALAELERLRAELAKR